MKKKATLILCSSIAVLGAVAVGAIAFTTQNDYGLGMIAEGNPYSLSFTSTTTLGADISIDTPTGGVANFKSSGLSAKDTDFGEFASLGYLTNDTAITGLVSITINFDESNTVSPLQIQLGIKKNGVIDFDTITPTTLSADGTLTIADSTSLDVAYFKILNTDASAVSDVKDIELKYTCTKAVTNYQKINYNVEGAVDKTVYVSSGSAFASAYTPTLSGYTFHEWEDSTGASLTGTTISAETSAYASWYRNVEKSVSDSVQTDFHSFASGVDTVSVGGGATFKEFANGGATVNGSTESTEYNFTLPSINYAAAISAGGEVTFDLYSSGWTYFYIGGVELTYDAEHNSTDPYHVSIKPNGVGYGVYVSSTTKGNYGEIVTLDSTVANGTAGLNIAFKSDIANRDVTLTKMSVYTLDYDTAISSALDAFTSSQTVATLAAYETAVSQNLTPYEKTQYSVPDAVTTAKTTLASQGQAVFSFPTISFSDTAGFIKQLAGVNTYTDMKWAAADTSDTTDDIYTNAWSGQIASGKSASFFEFPKIAYSSYGTVTFKSWMGTSGKVYVNGTLIESNSDCTNHSWCYTIKIVTTGSTSVMTMYHGDGSHGILQSGGVDTVQGTAWTLPTNVASGQVPLRFGRASTASTWTSDEAWGLSSMKGII